ncbi:hypothetical protein LDENG_00244780 [Lucifuga dentata]|nr:hypothetical protein LDENG_00244780 [Lucifuga dentata]
MWSVDLDLHSHTPKIFFKNPRISSVTQNLLMPRCSSVRLDLLQQVLEPHQGIIELLQFSQNLLLALVIRNLIKDLQNFSDEPKSFSRIRGLSSVTD